MSAVAFDKLTCKEMKKRLRAFKKASGIKASYSKLKREGLIEYYNEHGVNGFNASANVDPPTPVGDATCAKDTPEGNQTTEIPPIATTTTTPTPATPTVSEVPTAASDPELDAEERDASPLSSRVSAREDTPTPTPALKRDEPTTASNVIAAAVQPPQVVSTSPNTQVETQIKTLIANIKEDLPVFLNVEDHEEVKRLKDLVAHYSDLLRRFKAGQVEFT